MWKLIHFPFIFKEYSFTILNYSFMWSTTKHCIIGKYWIEDHCIRLKNFFHPCAKVWNNICRINWSVRICIVSKSQKSLLFFIITFSMTPLYSSAVHETRRCTSLFSWNFNMNISVMFFGLRDIKMGHSIFCTILNVTVC